MKIVGVIPARAKSSRFPDKPLANIAGLPMVIHVAKRLAAAIGTGQTYIATDDERIYDIAFKYGFNAVITSADCKTGTDRVCEFAEKINADIYINVQGDEPLVSPGDIQAIIDAKIKNPDMVINGMRVLTADEDPDDINIPKVLTSGDGNLIYASRFAIPAIKDAGLDKPVYKKQVCIYGFSKNELLAFKSYPSKAYCEVYEDIEILRFIDAGFKVKMIETKQHSIAVDIPLDVLKVEAFLKKEFAHNYLLAK